MRFYMPKHAFLHVLFWEGYLVLCTHVSLCALAAWECRNVHRSAFFIECWKLAIMKYSKI